MSLKNSSEACCVVAKLVTTANYSAKSDAQKPYLCDASSIYMKRTKVLFALQYIAAALMRMDQTLHIQIEVQLLMKCKQYLQAAMRLK